VEVLLTPVALSSQNLYHFLLPMAANPITKNGLFVHNNTLAPEHPSLMSMFSLKGKTAIVTGAGAGIGLAVAHGLAEAGANVAMWYKSNTKCPEQAAEVAKKYGVQST
jgi:sorbose reductase